MAPSRASFFWVAGFTGAALLNLLSLAGLADSVVKWRCFLDVNEIVATYQAVKAFLFGFLPWHLPGWLKDYVIITASFSLMLNLYAWLAERKSIRKILVDADGFRGVLLEIALFVIPWILLIWFGIRQVLWRRQFARVRNILDVDNSAHRKLEAAKDREDEKARLLTRIVVGYPLACVAALFVFSDFAYTLTGRSQIGGISFRQSCDARGQALR
jgi:hypothetical protein